jgi:hypothetical protein
MLASQQKFNETIQKNFTDVLNTLSKNGNSNAEFFINQQQQQQSTSPLSVSSQFQFQTQIQVQQLMFNLNTAYHEISMQKNEITNLHEQIKTINTKLADLSKPIHHQQSETHSIKIDRGIPSGSSLRPNDYKKEREQYEAEYNLNNTVISNNALPSYFYNQKSSANTQTDQVSNRHHHEAYYTDDFEEFEEDEEHDYKLKRNNSDNKNKSKLNKTNQLNSKKAKHSSSSSRTSSTSVDSSKASKSSVSSVSSSKSSTSCSSSSSKSKGSSTLALRKSSFSNTYEINSEASQTSNVLYEFDKMRELIYSEVASLISANEANAYYLLNLFKELQYLKTKSQREQILKSIYNISRRREQEHNKGVTKSHCTYNKRNLDVPSYKSSKNSSQVIVRFIFTFMPVP